ncbi:MAG: NAD(P)H dehydrogenase [Cupriavidus sp.]|nr:NAD(P)H dehydrogenase [Cupriavidus sp.]
MVAAPGVFAQSGATGTGSGAKPTTLIIASHPYPDRSVVNKALWSTAESAPGVVFRRLELLYGDNTRGIDVATEKKAYEGMDRVVFMFPIHWFNLTPMLKAYMNEIWTQWAPQALKGKKLMVVATAGADASAYSHEGRIGLTIQEVLAPMRASANYAGMTYLEPLAFLGVSNADEKAIRSYQGQLAQRLRAGVESRNRTFPLPLAINRAKS